MAKVTSIDVAVNVTIPDETVRRCLRILEMWMQDNPDSAIIVDRELTTTGYVCHARIDRRKGGEDNR
jgi:predicted amidohydrolase